MTTIRQRDFSAINMNGNLGMRMQQYPFIFSNERSWRLKRHLTFWIFWWLFMSVLYASISLIAGMTYLQRLPLSMVESALYLGSHIFLSYSLIYWAIPKLLLQGKYVQMFSATVLLVLAAAFIAAITGMYPVQYIRNAFFGGFFNGEHIQKYQYIFPAMMAGLRGSLSIGFIAAAIKLMKFWYIKEQRNLQLQKENAEAELQILKAQVHPHFLFNTLNNIYSFTQNTSPVASKLVMGLSEMLRYMLYECNQPLVPLQKELKMLTDYITLEEIRYNEHLDVIVRLPQRTEDFHIAPLLLLPFVENAFKHGASQMLEQPWISLAITIQNEEMEMKLMNGKSEKGLRTEGSGIGIANVKQRLELLYPGRYSLRITDEDDVFVVLLKLQLERAGQTKIIPAESLATV